MTENAFDSARRTLRYAGYNPATYSEGQLNALAFLFACFPADDCERASLLIFAEDSLCDGQPEVAGLIDRAIDGVEKGEAEMGVPRILAEACMKLDGGYWLTRRALESVLGSYMPAGCLFEPTPLPFELGRAA